MAARSHQAPRSVRLDRWRWPGATPSGAPCGSQAPDRPQGQTRHRLEAVRVVPRCQGQTSLAVAGSLPQATRRLARQVSRPVRPASGCRLHVPARVGRWPVPGLPTREPIRRAGWGVGRGRGRGPYFFPRGRCRRVSGAREPPRGVRWHGEGARRSRGPPWSGASVVPSPWPRDAPSASRVPCRTRSAWDASHEGPQAAVVVVACAAQPAPWCGPPAGACGTRRPSSEPVGRRRSRRGTRGHPEGGGSYPCGP